MQAYLDREAKESLYSLLERCHPAEVAHLLNHLHSGRIDGRSQRHCPIGIIAGFRRANYVISGLSGVLTWPMERWVKAIGPGDVPRNNRCAALLEMWLAEWLETHTLKTVKQHKAVTQ
jgi:hypothetical protein